MHDRKQPFLLSRAELAFGCHVTCGNYAATFSDDVSVDSVRPSRHVRFWAFYSVLRESSRAAPAFVTSGDGRSLDHSITQKAAEPVPAVVPDRGGRGAKMRGRRNKLPCSNTALHRVEDHKHRWRVANFLRTASQDLGRIANFTRDQQRAVMLPMNVVRMEIAQRDTRRCTTSISGENP